MVLGHRFWNNPVNFFKKLDAFPKIAGEYRERSRVGGTLSILSQALIVYFIYVEASFFMESQLKLQFEPDTEVDAHIAVNIDITVHMECNAIGYDMLDETGQRIASFGQLKKQLTWWTLCPAQLDHFNKVRQQNKARRKRFHSVTNLTFEEILYKGDDETPYNMPKRTPDNKNKVRDACRLHGTLTINKVFGLFVITKNENIPITRRRWATRPFAEEDADFSHRINRFSFGDTQFGIVQPLENDIKIITFKNPIVQYFIEIVPTDMNTLSSRVKTYQYSVKENVRMVDKTRKWIDVPGIFFKYGTSALKVNITEEREEFMHFAIRLCSVIAGIIVISGYLTSLFRLAFESLKRKYLPQKSKKIQSASLFAVESEPAIITPPLVH